MLSSEVDIGREGANRNRIRLLRSKTGSLGKTISRFSDHKDL